MVNGCFGAFGQSDCEDRGFTVRYVILITLLLLTACGGGGGVDSGKTPDGGGGNPPLPPDPRIARIDTYDALRLAILGDPDTGAPGLPATAPFDPATFGQVAFAGSVTIRAETVGRASVLAGDVNLTVDFADDTITGEMDRFFGTGPDLVLRDYSGVVTIDAGMVGNADPNSWELDYGGVLTATDQSVVLDGTVDGQFVGNPMTAMAGSELDAQIVYNGDPVDGVVTVLAQSVP